MNTGLGHYIPLLAFLVCVGACLYSLYRPLWGLYYLTLLLPYRTLRDHFLEYPLGGNILTILVICIFLGALLKGKRPAKSPMFATWLIFGVYLYLSMWLGVALSNAPLPLWTGDINFATWKDYMLLPIIFLEASMLIEDRKSVRTLVIFSALSVAFIDRASLMGSLSRSWGHYDDNKRDGGPLGFAGANGLAAFLAQFSLFFWGLVQFVKRKKAKIWFYVLVATTLLATMYAFSRAAYIAVVVGVIVLGILKDRKLIPIALAFLLVWQAVVPAAVSERVNMTKSSDGHLEASANERVELWTAAKETIIENPIFGVGYASYQLTAHTDGLRDTHNWYVKVMTETGAIGMLMALVLLFQMLALSWRVFRRSEDPLYKGLGLGCFLLIFSSILLNCFGDRWTYLEVNGLLWVLFGALVRVDRLRVTDAPAFAPVHDEVDAATPVYLAYR